VEHRVRVVGALEVVVRDLGAQVVYVVQADVAGEELKRLGQLQVGAAAQRRVGVGPLVGALPVDVLELVLDVEEPYPRGPGEDHRGHLDEQELLPSEQPAEPADHHREGDVGGDHAALQPRPCVAGDDPRHDHHRVDRPDAEHDQRVAEQAVAEPSLPGKLAILGHRQRVDVAGPAPVEVAGGGVMDGVLVAPAGEGRPDEQPGEGAEPAVGPLRREERPVGAVVEDDEGPQQEPGRRDRERQDQPVGDVEEQEHRHPQPQVGDHGRRDVEEAATQVRPGIWRQALMPEGPVRARFRIRPRESGHPRLLAHHAPFVVVSCASQTKRLPFAALARNTTQVRVT
jgi:hypothetical protein